MILTGSEYLKLPRKRTKRPKHAEWVDVLKESTPCMDCGGSFPAICMDFDHRPGTQKRRPIAAMRAGSLSRLKREISKCDLVCANCHRIRTLGRGPKPL